MIFFLKMIFVIVLKLFRIPGGGGGTQQMFLLGGSALRSTEPLTLLYTIFHEKGILFIYFILLFCHTQ